MKKALIVALVCVNVALLAALVLTAGASKANAQAYRGAADYLMVSGKIGTDWEAVYLLDLGRRRLLGFRFDKTSQQMLPIRGRILANDFRRNENEEDTGR